MLKPKVGDLVRLKPLVVAKMISGEDDCFIFRTAPGSALDGTWIKGDLIEEILPYPLQVGDRVRFYDSQPDASTKIILAIDDDAAWLKYESGTRSAHLLSVLRRA
jgi:hypothetical protein